jgi:hypothetical protein
MAAFANPAALGAVPELSFEIEGAEPASDSAVPMLRLALRVSSADRREINSIVLQAQVRIAPRRRSYGDGEEDRLTDLFGPTSQWASSLQGLLWANETVYVPRLTGSAVVDLPLACSYDFEVAAARYLAALEGGEIPLDVLFSGTVLYAAEGGRLQMTRIPLDRQASFGLPVAVWRAAIDRHFPGAAWLRLSRQSFDRLYAYRSREVLPSWEAAIDSLLSAHEEVR